VSWLLVLTFVYWAFGAVAVPGQTVAFNLSTAPTFVANTGRSEVLGTVALTADATCGTNADGLCVTADGTIQVLYIGTPIDNDIANASVGTPWTNGIEVCEVFDFIETCNVPGAILSGTFAATNFGAGGVVSFGINAGADLMAGQQIIVRGVRGQIDLSPGSVVGTSILAQMTASPSTIAGFSPTSEVVARSADPLTMMTNAATVQQCRPDVGTATITVIEGFNTAFVDHDGEGAIEPFPFPNTLNLRPNFGPSGIGGAARVLRNSRINIVLEGQPSGVTVSWPASSTVDSGSGFTGASLALVSQSFSGDTATYAFSTPNQAHSDISGERFGITLSASANITLSGTPNDFGTAAGQGRMFDPHTATSQPRYNHPVEPVPATTVLNVIDCDNLTELVMLKEADSASTLSGGELNYTILVANVSPFNNAENVIVSDALPDGVQFNSCTASPGFCAVVDGVVIGFLGTLSPTFGQPPFPSLQISATAPIITDIPLQVLNTAMVSTNTPELNPDDNESTAVSWIMPVGIDIEPGSARNAVNPRSNGKLTVAILTSPDFDASLVSPATVRFGPSEAEPEGVQSQDVDSDGDFDLVLQFRSRFTGIQCGDSTVILKGETFSGATFQSMDSITTTGCNNF
jgi:uncharacterized repeat protein (TIGR01451 family)